MAQQLLSKVNGKQFKVVIQALDTLSHFKSICKFKQSVVRNERFSSVMGVSTVDYENGAGYREDIQQSSFDLHDQKIVDRAKDILMRQRNLSENQAHEMLSTMAQKRNIKLVDVSKQLIETTKMLII